MSTHSRFLATLAVLFLVPAGAFAEEEREKEAVSVPGFGRMAKWVQGSLARENRSTVRVQLSRRNQGRLAEELRRSFEAALKKKGIAVVSGEEGASSFGVELEYLVSSENRVAMDIALKTKRNQVLGKFSSNFTLPDELAGGETDFDAVVASE